MKLFHSFFVLALTMIATSCTNYYYQVYDVECEGGQINSQGITFEDENCVVYYNLWNEAGSLSFVVENKTDNDLTIDLPHSFLIKNGMAHDYYQEQTVTKSSSTTLTTTNAIATSYYKLNYSHELWNSSAATSSNQRTIIGQYGSSVSTKSPCYIIIPAKSAKVIPGFSISNIVYKECHNQAFNTPQKESQAKVYTKDNTPLVFANRIAYYVGDKDKLSYIQNNFWIKSLTNYRYQYIVDYVKVDNCDNNPYLQQVQVNTKESPNKFYNLYIQ